MSINSEVVLAVNTNDLFTVESIPGIPIRELLLVCFISTAAVIFITGVLYKASFKWGLLPIIRDRDMHNLPMPRIGGIGIYFGILVGLFVAKKLPALARSFIYSNEITGVLVAGGLILLVGVADDIWGLDAITKLLGQVIASFILVLFHVGWTVIYVPFFNVGTIILDPLQTGILTILIVVTCVNSINFIDGLDGLAAGLSLIIMSSIGIFSLGLLVKHDGSVNYYPPIVISTVVIGTCIGFLCYNFFPAKIIMGDSGSMLLGFSIATCIISVSGKVSGISYGVSKAFLLLAPLLLVVSIMLIPMTDMLMAIFRRLKAGISPFMADKNHLHHRLLRLGYSHRTVVLLIYAWAAVPAFSVAVTTFTDWSFALVLFFLGLIVVYFFTFKEKSKLTLKKLFGKV